MNISRFTRAPDFFRASRRTLLRTGGTVLAGSALAVPAGHVVTTASAATHTEGTPTAMSYHVEGRLLEVCTCNILCPCWVGENPDSGTCDSALAWQIDSGQIEGVDVSGLALGLSVHIPGNVLEGNWRAVVYVDDRATADQEGAMLKVWTGQLGGPISDLAALIGEVITVERAAINFDVVEGTGSLVIGENVVAELAPFKGATGMVTALHESVFSTIPGSPAFVGKASRFFRDETAHGLSNLEISGYNAIQGAFVFEA
jgi:hypothetical protein